ncbi:MAG: hypothetical protein P8P83_05115 [Rickettsiaceae bacterium]|nr:hypothetical protein [Rickettsiaceae bacterium]
MPKNPSNNYNRPILKAIEELMAQEPLEDNIFVKLIRDKQPKTEEGAKNYTPKLNLASLAMFAYYNPKNVLKLAPLYNRSSQIITPEFQAALLKSPVTKDFITRIAGSEEIRNLFAKEGGNLFQEHGVFDDNGVGLLKKALKDDKNVESLQNIITQYVLQTKDKPMGFLEFSASILGEVNKTQSFQIYVANRAALFTEVIQNYISSRNDKEEVLKNTWEAMKDAKPEVKKNFLQESVGMLDDKEIDYYIKNHKLLPSFEKDTLGAYGLNVEDANKLVKDFVPVLLQQRDETERLLKAYNEGEYIEGGKTFFNMIDKDPKILEYMENDSDLINKALDKTLGDGYSSQVLQSFLANPDQNHAKSLIQNVVFPAANAIKKVKGYATKVQNGITSVATSLVQNGISSGMASVFKSFSPLGYLSYNSQKSSTTPTPSLRKLARPGSRKPNLRSR